MIYCTFRGMQSSFIPFTFSPLSFFFTPAPGDIAQLQLPANMKTLNIKRCEKITGAFLVKTVNESYFPTLFAAHAALPSSSSSYSSLSLLTPRSTHPRLPYFIPMSHSVNPPRRFLTTFHCVQHMFFSRFHPCAEPNTPR